MKIRTTIFGVYVAACGVGFAILLAFVLRESRARAIEASDQTLLHTARLLAGLLEAELATGNSDADTPLGALARRQFGGWRAGADGLRISVSDNRGELVFGSEPHDAASRPPGDATARVLSPPWSSATDLLGDRSAAVPLRSGGVERGVLTVTQPAAAIGGPLSRAQLRLSAGALALAALMVAIGWWLAGRLTHSLERLTAYAQAVRDGRSALPPESRAAEIAALARAFEEMRVSLEGKAYVERYTQALAHEFKAPLSAIRGAAELLAEDPPEPDRGRFLANLRAESARLQQIVERLLELASVEARSTGAALTPLSLADVIREAAAAGQPAADERRIRLQVAMQATPRVRGDKFLLVQAVGNLVQNALEFSPAGAGVTLTLAASGGQARITVEDSGPGVPDFARERIFERFYSLPRPDTGRKSSGLGLSLVREVARMHGGEATLENRPEGGARATLALPLG